MSTPDPTAARSVSMTPGSVSLASSLASLPEPERTELLKTLTNREAEGLLYDWKFWARPKQLPPEGIWRIWLVLAGRGFGKTRLGAEWVRREVESGRRGRLALVAPTAADARDVMVEGESGLLAISAPWFRPVYESSRRRLRWPSGAIATTYSADEPERLRGPQHDGAWADELGAWRYQEEAWAQLMFGLRLGSDPRVVVTTTPKPTRLIRQLVERCRNPQDVRATRGSSYENRAHLPDAFLNEIIQRYEGTTLGRQELWAEIIDAVEGALWKRELIEDARVPQAPELKRIVIPVDPAVTSSEDSCETGIVPVGLGVDGHGYVLADASGRYTPNEWARKAVEQYRLLKADRIIGEVNNGGDLVEYTVRTVDAAVSYRKVSASRGKAARAEPVVALYEQRKIHHVGYFAALEDQMCVWVPGHGSPDRLDALVWGLTELMLTGSGGWA